MGTELYPHVSVLLCAICCKVYVARALADSSNFLLLLEQSSRKNGRFPASDADEPPFKI